MYWFHERLNVEVDQAPELQKCEDPLESTGVCCHVCSNLVKGKVTLRPLLVKFDDKVSNEGVRLRSF